MSFLGHHVYGLPAASWINDAQSFGSYHHALTESPSFGPALYKAGRTVVDAFMHLMLDVDVEWQAPMPEGPKILAPNHPTTTDPFYILTLLSEPVSVLVTGSAFSVRGFGSYLWAAGHVPAIRGSGGATVDAVVEQVEDGRNVAIFPEGALSPLAGGFCRAHSGLARVALRTGAPVIPVGIGLQRERIRVVDANLEGGTETAHLYTSGKYAMTVGRPMYLEGDVADRERVHAATEQVMQEIRALSLASEQRVAQRLEAEAQSVPAWPFYGLPMWA